MLKSISLFSSIGLVIFQMTFAVISFADIIAICQSSGGKYLESHCQCPDGKFINPFVNNCQGHISNEALREVMKKSENNRQFIEYSLILEEAFTNPRLENRCRSLVYQASENICHIYSELFHKGHCDEMTNSNYSKQCKSIVQEIVQEECHLDSYGSGWPCLSMKVARERGECFAIEFPASQYTTTAAKELCEKLKMTMVPQLDRLHFKVQSVKILRDSQRESLLLKINNLQFVPVDYERSGLGRDINHLLNSFHLLQDNLLWLGKIDICRQERFRHQIQVKNMLDDYMGERIKYLRGDEKNDYKVKVIDGVLYYEKSGQKIDIDEAIYVMDEKGKIYVGKVNHHSSFLAGMPVSGAGTISAKEGRITYINNRSGHYRPNLIHLRQVLAVLILEGYKFDQTLEIETPF